MKICSVEGCNKPARRRGMCYMHYSRWRKYGDPLYTKNTKHGMANTSIYSIWHSMKQRCLNPNNTNYKNYGGRGIKVCNRWLEFKNFYKDMGDRPEGKELDRINNDGNYEPSNCRWITHIENNRNKRTTKLTPKQVKEIRILSLYFKRKWLAKHYKVGFTIINNIINYRKWQNI